MEEEEEEGHHARPTDPIQPRHPLFGTAHPSTAILPLAGGRRRAGRARGSTRGRSTGYSFPGVLGPFRDQAVAAAGLGGGAGWELQGDSVHICSPALRGWRVGGGRGGGQQAPSPLSRAAQEGQTMRLAAPSPGSRRLPLFRSSSPLPATSFLPAGKRGTHPSRRHHHTGRQSDAFCFYSINAAIYTRKKKNNNNETMKFQTLTVKNQILPKNQPELKDSPHVRLYIK